MINFFCFIFLFSFFNLILTSEHAKKSTEILQYTREELLQIRDKTRKSTLSDYAMQDLVNINYLINEAKKTIFTIKKFH